MYNLANQLKITINNLDSAIDSATEVKTDEKLDNLEKVALVFFDVLSQLPEDNIDKLKEVLTNHFTAIDNQTIIGILKIKSAINKGGVLQIKQDFTHKGIEIFKEIFNSTINNKKYSKPLIKKMQLEIINLLNDSQILRIYLNSGGDVNIQNKNKNSLLHQAITQGDFEIIKILIDAGAKCDAQNEDGITPLMVAAYYGDINTIRLLLKNHANTSITNTSGSTVLSYAAKRGHLDILKELLPVCTDLIHTSSWLFAKAAGHVDLVRILKQANMKTPSNRKWKNVKRLGHQFSLKGDIDIKEGESKTNLEFEGMPGTGIWLNKMAKVLKGMQEIPENHRLAISKALLVASNSKTGNAKDYLENFKKGEPIVIYTGWSGHSVEIVMTPPLKFGDPAYIYICNRGEGSKKPVEVFTFDAEILSQEYIQALIDNKANELTMESFQKIRDEIKKICKPNLISSWLEDNLSHLSMQTVGNCSWQSAETAVLVLMLAIELKEHQILSKEEFDLVFKRIYSVFELFGQSLRLEGVEKYIDDIMTTKKIEEFDTQLTLDSFVELWKLNIQDQDLLQRLGQLESIYLTHASPLIQIFFKILKLESQDALQFTPESLSTKEKAILKEGLISSEMRNYEKQFIRSIMTGNVSILKTLLEAGFDPNTPCNGKYPLVEAAKISNLEIVELLLDHKSDPNLSEPDLKTALYWSLCNNNVKMLELLVKKGANDINEDLKTPGATMHTHMRYFRIMDSMKKES